MKTNRLILVSLIAFLAAGALMFQSFDNFSTPKAPKKYLPLEDYLKSRSVKATAKSLGGHQGDCMVIELKNTSADSLFLYLEPGRRLVSKDSTHQDILIVKKKQIILPPLATMELKGNGFCCQSRKRSPRKDAEFYIGFIAPEEWIMLAKLINDNDFPASAVQHAVWVISDNNPIGSIMDDGSEDLYKLRKMVAKIKGVQLPWYSVKYEKDSVMLFSGRPEKITGIINYYLKNNSLITINIRNTNGKLVRTIVKDSPTGPGYHDYLLELNVKNWPNGEYYVFVYEDHSNLNIKKTFVL